MTAEEQMLYLQIKTQASTDLLEGSQVFTEYF